MVPPHVSGVASMLLGNPAAGYAPVPEGKYSPDLSRSSTDSQANDGEKQETPFPSRQTQLDDGDRWTQRVQLHDPQAPVVRPSILKKPVPSTYKPQTGSSTQSERTIATASRKSAMSPVRASTSGLLDPQDTTPKAHRLSLADIDDEPLFDSSPLGPASRATRPTHDRAESTGATKKMTSAQFQALQRHSDATKILRNEPDHSGDEYEDEDDVDRAKKMATQRRKQEANMAVYRQQMKKVTGGGPTDLPGGASMRPSIDRGSSAPASIGSAGLHFGGIGGTPPPDVIPRTMDDDEDDDIPLGVLQAHGFPSSNRPPTRQGENDFAYQRRTSVAGSVAGGAGPLPPFARRLPADPYFGAGLVNHSARESLAFGNSGASIYGGAPSIAPSHAQMGHPGGLVGVIAGEERARAARRGSPSVAMMAQSGGAPLPSNMQAGRTMSMGNLPPPQVYMPSGAMPGMPMMPPMPPVMSSLDPGQQAQLQQFMQMQMQFMQNMQNMMQMQQAQMGQTPPPMQTLPGDYLGVNLNSTTRPMSMASHAPGSASQPFATPRAMTMMTPPTGWNGVPSRPNSIMPGALGNTAGGPGPGYTPSIAPSERSNVGMPSRYRPVTQSGDDFGGSVKGGRTHSLTSSLTLQGYAPGSMSTPDLLGSNSSTIRVVDRPKSSGTMGKMGMRRSVGQDEDEEEGWADMKKKRESRKKDKAATQEGSIASDLGELYKNFD